MVSYARSEGANPVFSVARGAVSKLQEELIKAYSPLRYEACDLKSQVIREALNQLKTPFNFNDLPNILHETVLLLRKESVNFTITPQEKPITQEEIDTLMGFSSTAEPKDYIESLLGYCAPNLFDTIKESPFNTLTQAENWSIATQFLLGIINIHALSKEYISPDTNFGRILDNSTDLSKELAQTLAHGQEELAHTLTQGREKLASIEERCIAWMNEHANELGLKNFNDKDIDTIKETFATLYSEIKGSLHFDEFLILNRQKKAPLSFIKRLFAPILLNFLVPRGLSCPCTLVMHFNALKRPLNPWVRLKFLIKIDRSSKA